MPRFGRVLILFVGCMAAAASLGVWPFAFVRRAVGRRWISGECEACGCDLGPKARSCCPECGTVIYEGSG